MTTWTHETFDSMSWHDNHVHSLRIVEGEAVSDFINSSSKIVPYRLHSSLRTLSN
jgi:hypothetical protein